MTLICACMYVYIYIYIYIYVYMYVMALAPGSTNVTRVGSMSTGSSVVMAMVL